MATLSDVMSDIASAIDEYSVVDHEMVRDVLCFEPNVIEIYLQDGRVYKITVERTN